MAEGDTARDDPQDVGAPQGVREAVRIVAIGASAGGLEPIEQFFEATPPDLDVAYVVIQHLSPDFRSMMPELLERHSKLPIHVIANGMPIEANTIYLNPPRSTLGVVDGAFALSEVRDASELNLPINDFLASLAQHAGHMGVAVVLSGTGSDGTIGSEDVAAAGGVVLAQDPATAKFESMPRSVIDAVPGALYAAPGALPALIQRVVAGERPTMGVREPSIELSTPEREIVRLLQARYGLDFGYYKTSTVGRRISRRAQLAGYDTIGEYAQAVSVNPEELEALYADLLIGVTAFFRDRPAFDVLRTKVMPGLAEIMRAGEEVRAWVPGCASGEEAYSLAIMLAERARLEGLEPRVRIFGTDIHPRSLKVASRAIYSAQALSGLPEDLRARYFEQNGNQYQLNTEIREKVVFSKHNVIKDPPFTRMYLVSCRNLMIYLDDEAQRKAVAMFHFALKRNGILFLGPSETLGGLAHEFTTIDSRWRVFSKRRDVRLVEATRLLPLTSQQPRPIAQAPEPRSDGSDPVQVVVGAGLQRHLLMRIYDAILSRFTGTSLLVGPAGEVMHVFNDGGRFLSFRQGQFSQRLGDLIDPQLKLTVLGAIDRVHKSTEDEIIRTVRVQRADGDEKVLIRVVAVDTGGPLADAPVFVSFRVEPVEVRTEAQEFAEPDGASGDDMEMLQRQVQDLERNLRFSEETLQTTIEELETSNEELQATNEELQATNEELMAANEELQTVNEELHAVNEELFTVSSEHQSKIGELTEMTNDLENLMRSTSIGVLFLDAQKNIRSITPAVARTFNILARDVGRPVSHVTSRFEFPDLEESVGRVIDGEGVVERNIEVDGRDYLLRVLPYKRNDRIDGAVLTFVDITDIARLNRSLGQFADIVSHDLKAPLRAIRTAVDWISEDLGDGKSTEVDSHLERLASQTQRLSDMLSDLRKFSNQNEQNERRTLVHLPTLLAEISAFYPDDQLVLTFDPDLPSVETSRTALHLVLQNLVDNAVKHNDRRPTRVEINVRRDGARWEFEVVDDGPGIDPRHHAKIFLPFRKLAPATESPGSGIGLAMVKKTIEDRTGTIEIASDPSAGRGTRFTFVWPA